MRFGVIFIAILLSCGQKKSEVFTWEGIERPLTNQTKREALSKIDDAIVRSYHQMSEETGSLDVYSLFHFLDINGDGFDDVVFNGYGGAADEYIMIFIGLPDGFEKRLHCYGHINDWVLSQQTFAVVEKEFVGDNSGDSLSIYNLQGDRIVKTSSVRIK